MSLIEYILVLILIFFVNYLVFEICLKYLVEFIYDKYKKSKKREL